MPPGLAARARAASVAVLAAAILGGFGGPLFAAAPTATCNRVVLPIVWGAGTEHHASAAAARGAAAAACVSLGTTPVASATTTATPVPTPLGRGGGLGGGGFGGAPAPAPTAASNLGRAEIPAGATTPTTVTTADGTTTLEVPPGVVGGAVSLTVEVAGMSAPPTGALRGTDVQLWAAGGALVHALDQPIVVSFTYTAAELNAAGVAESALGIYTSDGGAWTRLDTTVAGGVATASATHLSSFALAPHRVLPVGFGCPCSIWRGATPGVASSDDPEAVEVGVRFRAAVDGEVTGLRFYKGPANTGTHVGHLWSASGQLLATATFVDETPLGWQRASLSAPVRVEAGRTYVASYHTDAGGYAHDWYFGEAVQSGPLRALADGEDGPNGVFHYGASAFPSDGWKASNYWVDVVFDSDAADLIAPRLLSVAPLTASTGVDPQVALEARFDEPVELSSVVFQLRGPAGPVDAVASYDAESRAVTLRPRTALALATTYEATVSAALDLAGNPLAAPRSWSFTTAVTTPARTITPGQLTLAATFNSIGIELPFVGDDDADATTSVAYKRAGDASWSEAMPLWATTDATGPGRAFYGSVLFVQPGTTYDVRVTIADPDGVVGTQVATGQVTTRTDSIAPAAALAPSRYVRADGDDGNDGLTEQHAWRTLAKAVADAPPGAVVQVGAGYYAVSSPLRRGEPLTLVAEHAAVDDDRQPINQGSRSVVEWGVVSGPAPSTEPGVIAAPWESVAVVGPGYAGAPAGATYRIWRWAHAPAGVSWLGYASSRAELPRRVALWETKGADLETPAGWVEKLFTNRTYSYGWAPFPDGAGGVDLYLRLPSDVDPNTVYMTAGGESALEVSGPDVRLSGFELRPFSNGVWLDATAERAVVDHNLILVGFVGVRLQGDKDAAPSRYGADHVIERNLILDSSLRTQDENADPAIPWLFVKGGIYNGDGSIYPPGRIGEANETTGVWSRGGARRVVVRRNTIDGPFNGIAAYNADFDRFATAEQDVQENLIRNIADDAFEPEQVGINWRIWNNRVERSSTVLSTGPLSYGPLYLVRNEAWRIGREGVGRTNMGQSGVAAVFFKYSGQSIPPARLYVVNNTFWTDSAYAGPTDVQKGVDGAGQYAGGGRSPERFFLRNNVIRATRYAFQNGSVDEQANSISTSDTTRGFDTLGRRWTTDVDVYRVTTGHPGGTNVGWDPATGLGSFVSPPDAWLRDAPGGDLAPADGSPFVDGGVVVPNLADAYNGAAPDLGATER